MSAIDPTQPPEGEAYTAPVRENFAQAKADIERVGIDDDALDVVGAHPARTDNPHAVTAAQAGADEAGAATAVQDNLDTHTGDTANPHAVTKAQVGASLLTAGTSCVKNAYATSTTTTQAHGLGATPTFIISYLECLTAELNYSIGDRVQANSDFSQGSSFAHWCVEYDTTNVAIILGANLPTVLNKTTQARTAITAANWKFVAVPYLLS